MDQTADDQGRQLTDTSAAVPPSPIVRRSRATQNSYSTADSSTEGSRLGSLASGSGQQPAVAALAGRRRESLGKAESNLSARSTSVDSEEAHATNVRRHRRHEGTAPAVMQQQNICGLQCVKTSLRLLRAGIPVVGANRQSSPTSAGQKADEYYDNMEGVLGPELFGLSTWLRPHSGHLRRGGTSSESDTESGNSPPGRPPRPHTASATEDDERPKSSGGAVSAAEQLVSQEEFSAEASQARGSAQSPTSGGLRKDGLRHQSTGAMHALRKGLTTTPGRSQPIQKKVRLTQPLPHVHSDTPISRSEGDSSVHGARTWAGNAASSEVPPLWPSGGTPSSSRRQSQLAIGSPSPSAALERKVSSEIGMEVAQWSSDKHHTKHLHFETGEHEENPKSTPRSLPPAAGEQSLKSPIEEGCYEQDYGSEGCSAAGELYAAQVAEQVRKPAFVGEATSCRRPVPVNDTPEQFGRQIAEALRGKENVSPPAEEQPARCCGNADDREDNKENNQGKRRADSGAGGGNGAFHSLLPVDAIPAAVQELTRDVAGVLSRAERSLHREADEEQHTPPSRRVVVQFREDSRVASATSVNDRKMERAVPRQQPALVTEVAGHVSPVSHQGPRQSSQIASLPSLAPSPLFRTLFSPDGGNNQNEAHNMVAEGGSVLDESEKNGPREEGRKPLLLPLWTTRHGRRWAAGRRQTAPLPSKLRVSLTASPSARSMRKTARISKVAWQSPTGMRWPSATCRPCPGEVAGRRKSDASAASAKRRWTAMFRARSTSLGCQRGSRVSSARTSNASSGFGGENAHGGVSIQSKGGGGQRSSDRCTEGLIEGPMAYSPLSLSFHERDALAPRYGFWKVIAPSPLKFSSVVLEEAYATFCQDQVAKNLRWSLLIVAITVLVESCWTVATTASFDLRAHRSHRLYTFGKACIVVLSLPLAALSFLKGPAKRGSPMEPQRPLLAPWAELIVNFGGVMLCVIIVLFTDPWRVSQLAGENAADVWDTEEFSDAFVLLSLVAIVFCVAIFLPVRAVCQWPICLSCVVMFHLSTCIYGSPQGGRSWIATTLLLVLLCYLAMVGRRALEAQTRLQFLEIQRVFKKIQRLEKQIGKNNQSLKPTNLENVFESVKGAKGRMELAVACLEREHPKLVKVLSSGVQDLADAIAQLSRMDVIPSIDIDAILGAAGPRKASSAKLDDCQNAAESFIKSNCMRASYTFGSPRGFDSGIGTTDAPAHRRRIHSHDEDTHRLTKTGSPLSLSFDAAEPFNSARRKSSRRALSALSGQRYLEILEQHLPKRKSNPTSGKRQTEESIRRVLRRPSSDSVEGLESLASSHATARSASKNRMATKRASHTTSARTRWARIFGGANLTESSVSRFRGVSRRRGRRIADSIQHRSRRASRIRRKSVGRQLSRSTIHGDGSPVEEGDRRQARQGGDQNGIVESHSEQDLQVVNASIHPTRADGRMRAKHLHPTGAANFRREAGLAGRNVREARQSICCQYDESGRCIGHGRTRVFFNEICMAAMRPSSLLWGYETVPPVGSDPEEAKEAMLQLCMGIGLLWNLNMPEIDTKLAGDSLVAVGLYLLDPYVKNYLFVDPDVALNFLRRIQGHYKPNPYHNSSHAADVAHSVTWLCNSMNIFDRLQCKEQLSVIVGALCHDVGHPARNNAFHVSTSSNLAIVYNDQSVLENYHCAKTFQILSRLDCNIFLGLQQGGCRKAMEEQRCFRSCVIDLVLTTDMGKHFEALSLFKVRRQAPSFSFLDDESDRWSTVRMLLKAADIGHSSKTWEIHFRQSLCVIEEFFSQGDEEAHLGLPISPLCDRSQAPDVPKSQMGFLQFVCLELYEELSILQADEDSEAESDPDATIHMVIAPPFADPRRQRPRRHTVSAIRVKDRRSTCFCADRSHGYPHAGCSPAAADRKAFHTPTTHRILCRGRAPGPTPAKRNVVDQGDGNEADEPRFAASRNCRDGQPSDVRIVCFPSEKSSPTSATSDAIIEPLTPQAAVDASGREKVESRKTRGGLCTDCFGLRGLGRSATLPPTSGVASLLDDIVTQEMSIATNCVEQLQSNARNWKAFADEEDEEEHNSGDRDKTDPSP